MADISVRGNQLTFQGRDYRCAIGKSGFSGNKKEGDGCTPLGTFLLRECWYRADRLPKPDTKLPLKVIQKSDGWCDDPKAREYNQHIVIPPNGGIRTPQQVRGDKMGYENLWREDHAYDLIIPLGYNDAPVVPGKGSAIFLHVAQPPATAALERDITYAPTEGCVALALPDLQEVLKLCGSGTVIDIRAS